jgi:hypothetical protein
MYDTLIVITDEQSHDGIASVLQGTKGYIINVASARNGVGYGQFTHIDGFSSSIVEWLINEQNEYTKYHSITGRGIQIGSIVINDIHKGG